MILSEKKIHVFFSHLVTCLSFPIQIKICFKDVFIFLHGFSNCRSSYVVLTSFEGQGEDEENIEWQQRVEDEDSSAPLPHRALDSALLMCALFVIF